MKLAERINKIKYEFFEEFYQLIKDYDIERMRWDENYEISEEADSKWEELLDCDEDWMREFWSWVAQGKGGAK